MHGTGRVKLRLKKTTNQLSPSCISFSGPKLFIYILLLISYFS